MKLLLLLLMFSTTYALEIKGDLVIVHPSRTWDPMATAKKGIDRAIEAAKLNNSKIYLLRHNDRGREAFADDKYSYKNGSWVYDDNGSKYPSHIDSYYINDKSVTTLSSKGGENDIKLISNEVTIVGGYIEFCMATAIGHLISNNGPNIKVNIYLPGSFTHHKNNQIPDEFNILNIWPYPVNPGFIYLERQINIRKECIHPNFVTNSMVNYGGDDPILGSSGLTNLQIEVYCNDEPQDVKLVG